MTQLLIVILYDVNHLPELLDVWEEIGVPGVTILESAGGRRARNWLKQVGLGAIGDLFSSADVRGKTLLALIDDEELLERAIAEAERVVDDIHRPAGSLLFVLPVNRTVGVLRLKPEEKPAPPPAPIFDKDLITRQTPISVVNQILKLEPVIVETNYHLLEVAEAMIQNPMVTVACVVNKQGRLVGLLSLRSLADDLFMHIIPEEFLSEAHGLEGALDFARLARTETAGDAMIEPVWVKEDDTVKEAFRRMHDNQISGIPMINNRYEVTGYINLLQLLAICAREQKPPQSDQSDE
ncbi:MAG: CBS domain-containing protein [Anaerolineae bacterium]